MAQIPAPQVYLLRLGPAAQRLGASRVRWVYAIQCTDEETLRQRFEMLGLGSVTALGAHEIQSLLAALPPGAVLAGAGEIQAASKRDPGLRRALKAARESLREDTGGTPANTFSDRDKGVL